MPAVTNCSRSTLDRKDRVDSRYPRAFLEQHRPLLDALRPVLGMPTGRVTVDFAENPLETTLPSLAGLRTAAKLSRLDAILRLIDGDTGGALDTAVLQFHIASSLNEYPSVIGHLVAMACDRLGLRTAASLPKGNPSWGRPG